MIRVAVFIPRYFPIFGGAENQAKLLNRELIASKKVTIPFLLTHRLNKELEKKIVIDEIKVHRLGLPGMGLWSSLSFLLTSVLFLLIHHRKLDVIHSHASSVPGFFVTLVGIIIRKPVILKLSTNGELLHQPRSLVKKILRKWMLMIMSKSANFVCLNQEGLDELNHIKVDNKFLIPNGISFIKKNYHLNRHSLGIDSDDLVIVFVGRFVKRKGINILLEAFELLLTQAGADKIKLLLLGSSDNQDDCVHLERISNKYLIGRNVIIKAALPDEVADYLNLSNIFVSCSQREGMPNVVLEGISAGLPCILSDIQPHKEIVVSCINRESLFLYSTHDAIDLKNILFNIITSCQVKKVNIVRLPVDFNIVTVANNYVKLYEKLVS